MRYDVHVWEQRLYFHGNMLQVEGFNSCNFSAVIWFSTFNLWVSSASTLYPNDQELLYFFYLHVPFSSPLYLGSDISF